MQRRLSASWAEAPPRSPQGSLNSIRGRPVRSGAARARGRPHTPELVDERVAGDDLVGVQQQGGEQGALLRATERGPGGRSPVPPATQESGTPSLLLALTATWTPPSLCPRAPGRCQSPSGRLSAANEYRTR